MTTPTSLEINCSTGEVIERPLTSEEISQRELDAEAFAVEQAKRDADEAAKQALKASAKAKLVAGESLTEDEAAVLVI